MNLFLLLAVSTWHIVGGINSFESQLFSNNTDDMKYAIGEIFKNEIRFSLELYKSMADVETGFFALSTVGAYEGLSMLNCVANGLTKQQLSNVLNYSPNSCVARHGLRRLATTLTSLYTEGIHINAKIFHSYEMLLLDAFTEYLDDVFDSIPLYVACWNELTNGNAIANWGHHVGIRHSRIQTFDGEKSLILATAASLSGKIDLNEFGACYLESSFYSLNGSVTERFPYVQIMARLNYGEFSYRRDSNGVDVTAQVIKLAWANSWERNIETILILPNERDGIMELEKNLNEATIHKILSNTAQHLVVAHLPIFAEIATAKNLKKPLENMQLKRMFNVTNDFESVMKNHSTMVGAVMHECEIFHTWLYDFRRCPANAIDDLTNVSSYAMEIFNANHAFIILIVSNAKNPLILSMGRYDWLSDEVVGRHEILV